MLKIMQLLLSSALLLAASSCSNDKEMPAQYHSGLLPQPTGVEVTLENGVVSVSWQIASTENVVGFVVSFTDPSGISETKSVEDSAARSYEDDGSLSLESGSGYLIHVWAVDESDFFGQKSEPFTLIVP